ncbi:MAG: hypothetical protein SCH66_07395 [Methanolobus sp.]|nr:hypothetical protein [Methanolobus sp.]
MICKYFSQCEHASSTDFTCTEDEGGTYCGKFRTMAGETTDTGSSLLLFRPFLQLREILEVL